MLASETTSLPSNPRLRAFKNLGASCFVNASVTAILSVKRFQAFFRDYWHSEVPAEKKKTVLMKIAMNEVSNKDDRKVLYNDTEAQEEHLAATFMAATSNPMRQSIVPYLLTDIHYNMEQAEQDDASQLMDRMMFQKDRRETGQRTRLERLCSMGYQQYYRCIHCNAKVPRGDANFQTILYCQLDNGNVTSVQQALNLYFQEEVQPSDEWRCDACGSTEYPMKSQEIISMPDVLMINLERFTFNAAGQMVTLNHEMDANENLRFKDTEYKLVSCVYHQGDNPNMGHYTATVLGLTNADELWYHNDEIVKRCEGRHVPGFKLRVCIYERRA